MLYTIKGKHLKEISPFCRLVPYFGTSTLFLCNCKLKTTDVMWIAVMIFVFLGVEILNYLNGENSTSEGFDDEMPEFEA